MLFKLLSEFLPYQFSGLLLLDRQLIIVEISASQVSGLTLPVGNNGTLGIQINVLFQVGEVVYF
jgi:hypothetical protein